MYRVLIIISLLFLTACMSEKEGFSNKKTNEILKELKQLESNIAFGLNYKEYRDKLISVKAVYDLDIEKVIDNKAKVQLGHILEIYISSYKIWSYKIDSKLLHSDNYYTFDEYKSNKSIIVGKIAEQYGVKYCVVNLDGCIQKLWNKASKEIQHINLNE